MSLWACRRCGAHFAVGLSMCPQCTSTDHEEAGDPMPKITIHGGPTNDAADQAAATALTEGGEQPSAGTSSSTSTPNSPTPPSGETTSNPSPAPTTESRSGKARTGSSTARSTGTGQRGAKRGK